MSSSLLLLRQGCRRQSRPFNFYYYYLSQKSTKQGVLVNSSCFFPSFMKNAKEDSSSFATSIYYFSTTVAPKQTKKKKKSNNNNKQQQEEENGNDNNDYHQKQSFVDIQLRPGEWDRFRKDPLYGPKFRSNVRIISAEDYANRPQVVFEEDFESYEDAMYVPTWITQKQSQEMYSMYVNLMTKAYDKQLKKQQNDNNNNNKESMINANTSHEYVIKVIAQQYNIKAARAAAIIQLQHDEEQMKRTHPELLNQEQSDYIEQEILKTIQDALRSEGGRDKRVEFPNEFVEDPVGLHGRGGQDETSPQYYSTLDIYDMDAREQDVDIQDEQRARHILDTHVYLPDYDNAQEKVPIDNHCRKLLKQKERLSNEQVQDFGTILPHPETNTDGVKRNRWKYVAQIVDTRVQGKKKNSKLNKYSKNKQEKIMTVGYQNGIIDNTVVEQDGEIRPATLLEAQQVAWRKERDLNEFIYAGVKQAWIDKVVHGKQNEWGPAPEPVPQRERGSKISKQQKQQQQEEKENTDNQEINTAAEASSDESHDLETQHEEEADNTIASEESTPDDNDVNDDDAPEEPSKGEETKNNDNDEKK